MTFAVSRNRHYKSLQYRTHLSLMTIGETWYRVQRRYEGQDHSTSYRQPTEEVQGQNVNLGHTTRPELKR